MVTSKSFVVVREPVFTTQGFRVEVHPSNDVDDQNFCVVMQKISYACRLPFSTDKSHTGREFHTYVFRTNAEAEHFRKWATKTIDYSGSVVTSKD